MEIAVAIGVRLARGETLISVCGKDGFPDTNTIHEWVKTRQDVASVIARARLDGYDAIAEQALAIADDRENDYGEDGYEPEHVSRAKLRVETRLKLLAKWDPKRYGDAPAQTVVQVGVSVHAVSAEELERIAALKADARRLLRERG